MCGRYGLFADLDDLGAQLAFDPAAVRDAYRPRWNIAPTAPALVVESGAVGGTGGRIGRMLRWGGPARRPRFNIRAETIAGWRNAIYRRCLVPANGFYEWQAGPGGSRTPLWFQPADGGVIAMAGIRFDTSAGASCAVVTGPANSLVSPVHHRMPVILEPDRFDEWLDGSGVAEVLSDCREWPGITARMVSGAVNRAGNDGPHLIEALSGDGGSGRLPGFGRLF